MSRAWPLTLRGTGALVLSVACFIAARELGLVELVGFGVLLLALVAACAVTMLVDRRRGEVTRTVTPAAPTAGGEIAVAVHVIPTSALATTTARWHDELPEGMTGDASGAFPAIASGLSRGDRTVELSYRASVRRRGIHQIGPLAVSATDPFGLIRRRAAVGDTTRIVVRPALVDLRAISALQQRAGGTLPISTDRLGQGADDLIARPYAPGDSRRRIHWRASAHRDELMVRQEEQEAAPEATVVLDRAPQRWAPEANETTGADAAFEAAVSACASALARLVRDGFAVALIDTDGMSLCAPVDAADVVGLEQAMLALAEVRAAPFERPAALAELFAGRMTGPLVVVTGYLEETDAAALAPIAHRSSLPMLLAATPDDDVFAAAIGWHASRIGADIDLAEAWESATAERIGHARA